MKTTININKNSLAEITQAAQKNGISRTEQIVVLLHRVMHDTHSHYPLGKAVRYQGKRDPDEWHRFHVRLKDEEYEYFLDLRKILKMSVSLILAYAVKKYLNVVLKKNNSDNYRFQNYYISKETVNRAIIWKFFWGIPPDLP